jgi:hypothetical protein
MRLTIVAIALVALTACVHQEPKDFTAYHAADPHSILVVPVANESLDVDAPNYVLSSLAVPLAEKGYYVFPLNTTKVVLEQEGFYEPDQIRNVPAENLAKLFGADAVLYVTIKRWDAQYAVLSTAVTVEFDYKMVDRQGVEIWTATQAMVYQPQQQNSGNPIADLIGAAITAAITRASPNYMPLTRQANQAVFISGPNAIPDGPYGKKP